MIKRLILLRHGQSQWNLENRFTGWTDVELSVHGEEEARLAGKLMKDAGIVPDCCVTSYLRRAIHTMQIVLAQTERDWVPVVKDWRLNERHYGALQGMDKAKASDLFGERKVNIWRRSYDVKPPMVGPDDPRWPGNDPKYASVAVDRLPFAESLKDTMVRVRDCKTEFIMPALRTDNTVLVVAHGNTLRGLDMMIECLTPADIVDVEIPNGRPWVFEFDDRLVFLRKYYL